MKVVVISDTHFPFHSKNSLGKLLALIETERPHAVIQIGDLLDQYSFSKYSRSLNVMTPEAELIKGRAMAAKMWESVRRAVPKAKCIQMLGNHDTRLHKRVTERAPELEGLVSSRELYTFKGVRTMSSDRDFVELDGVVYCHGWLSKSIDHARHFNKPTVHGHRHRPAIETHGRLWSMDVGFLGNEQSLPFSYTLSKITNWRTAGGLVVDQAPRLILL